MTRRTTRSDVLAPAYYIGRVGGTNAVTLGVTVARICIAWVPSRSDARLTGTGTPRSSTGGARLEARSVTATRLQRSDRDHR
jgi:hypothetical protein